MERDCFDEGNSAGSLFTSEVGVPPRAPRHASEPSMRVDTGLHKLLRSFETDIKERLSQMDQKLDELLGHDSPGSSESCNQRFRQKTIPHIQVTQRGSIMSRPAIARDDTLSLEHSLFHTPDDTPKVPGFSTVIPTADTGRASCSYGGESLSNVASQESLGADAVRQSQSSKFHNLVVLVRRHPTTFAGNIWRFLEDPDSSNAAWWFSHIWEPFIIFTILVTVLQTIEAPPLSALAASILEFCFDLAFTIEVLMRFLASNGYLVFMKKASNIIDILAGVVPLTIRACTGLVSVEHDSSYQMFLSGVVPVLRVLKTMRRSQKFYLIVALIAKILEVLRILLFTFFVVVLAGSAILYIVEPPDNINSLPKAMWLMIVTVTTVGYGDVVPQTTIGTLVVAIMVMCSVLYMAMPIGIIGNAFTQIWEDRDRILLIMRTRDRLQQWGYTVHDMVQIFQHFDSNGDGDLSPIEFKNMIAEMQIGLNEERVLELFDSIDKDTSGGIDLKEFCRTLFPGAYHQVFRENPMRRNIAPAFWSRGSSKILEEVDEIAASQSSSRNFFMRNFAPVDIIADMKAVCERPTDPSRPRRPSVLQVQEATDRRDSDASRGRPSNHTASRGGSARGSDVMSESSTIENAPESPRDASPHVARSPSLATLAVPHKQQ